MFVNLQVKELIIFWGWDRAGMRIALMLVDAGGR